VEAINELASTTFDEVVSVNKNITREACRASQVVLLERAHDYHIDEQAGDVRRSTLSCGGFLGGGTPVNRQQNYQKTIFRNV